MLNLFAKYFSTSLLLNPFLIYFPVSLLVHCRFWTTLVAFHLLSVPIRMTDSSHRYHISAYLMGSLSWWKLFSRVPLLSNGFPNIFHHAVDIWGFSLSWRFPSVWFLFLILAITIHSLHLCLWKALLCQIFQGLMVALSGIGPCPLDHRGEHMTKSWSEMVPHLLSHNDLSQTVIFKIEHASESTCKACESTDCWASPQSFHCRWPRVGPQDTGSEQVPGWSCCQD